MYAEIDRPLDLQSILERTRHLQVGASARYFESVGSTNDVAYHCADHGEEEGTVIIADEQKTGKGRLNRHWSSERFKGIYASIILRPEISVVFASRFTILASVSAVRSIWDVCRIHAHVKWPNDIMIGDKKVGGILAEIKVQERSIKFTIVGIGINVNHLEADFSEDIRSTATSLLIETVHAVAREDLLVHLLTHMDALYKQVLSDDFSPILDEWKSISPSHSNCPVIVANGDRSYQGITRGVTENGELVIEKQSGENIIVSFGDLITISRAQQ